MRVLPKLKVGKLAAEEAITQLLSDGSKLLEMNTMEYQNGVLSSVNVDRSAKELRRLTRNWVVRVIHVLSQVFKTSPLSDYNLIASSNGLYPNLSDLRDVLHSLKGSLPSSKRAGKSTARPTGVLHPKIEKHCKQFVAARQFPAAVFEAFKVVETEVRRKAKAEPEDIGMALISKVMNPGKPVLSFSDIASEREAFHSLYRGALGGFKNPHSHRFVKIRDDECLELLSFASLLLRLLKDARVVR